MNIEKVLNIYEKAAVLILNMDSSDHPIKSNHLYELRMLLDEIIMFEFQHIFNFETMEQSIKDRYIVALNKLKSTCKNKNFLNELLDLIEIMKYHILEANS